MVPAPVEIGLVASLMQPGGNITGLTHFELTMAGKWLEALKEVSPGLYRVAFLLHDIFETPLNEVAAILKREAAAVRQLASRARCHVREARPR